jgi:hypothetical protein
MMTIDKRRARLAAWLEVIRHDLERIAISNYMFWELQKIVRRNRRLRKMPGLYFQWTAWCFVDSTVIGVRRQLKNRSAHNKCISLRGVLQEIYDYPDLVSRAHYLSFFKALPAWQSQVAEEHFDRMAGKGGERVRLSILGRDIRRLETKALAATEKWADRRTAHWNQGNVPPGTFNNLKTGLRTLESVLQRYLVLITGNAPTQLVPAIQFDWQEPLTIPWIRRDKEPPLSS